MADATPQAPVPAVGDRFAVAIHDIAFGGEGVARVDEFVILVPFVAAGEEVEVEITDVKKKFARPRLMKVLKASPDRVGPLCGYFGGCVGCKYHAIASPPPRR